MSFFEKIIQQLFQKPTQKRQKLSEPMVSEPLNRKDVERKLYFEWQNSGAYKRTLQQFYSAYQSRLRLQMATWDVHLLQMPAANGIALTYPKTLKPQEFQHLFDLLKDKVLNLGYNLINADRFFYDKQTFVETREKYYLKPIIDFQDTDKLYDQRYGNILIEKIQVDQEPSYLKLVASIYSDRLYTKALPFESLMDLIFEVDTDA